MSVNGINNTNISDMYATNTTAKEKLENTTPTSKEVTTESTNTKSDTAAVYEKSEITTADREAIIEQLKADQEKRQQQLTELVTGMMSKQAETFGNATDIWKFLAKGDFTVDEATKKKAQEDIAEDGYWGVEQTSQRIIDFAKALAGDDEEALEEMKNAFLKGYEQAEETWGGKLPEISQKTYDAVLAKFDKLMNKETAETTKPTDEGNVVVKENTTTDVTTEKLL